MYHLKLLQLHISFKEPPVSIQSRVTDDFNMSDTDQKSKPQGAMWKLTIWMSAWKVLFTLVFSFLLGYINMGQTPTLGNYWDGWNWSNLANRSDLILSFLGNMIGSIVG